MDTLQPEGVSFAQRRGLAEVDCEVELRRPLGGEPVPEPAPLPGLEVVSIAERPELLEATWHGVAVEGYRDLPTPSPVEITLEQWLEEEATLPEASFVALDGDAVVGYAGLLEGGEHGLTAVRRSVPPPRDRDRAEAAPARVGGRRGPGGARHLDAGTQQPDAARQRAARLPARAAVAEAAGAAPVIAVRPVETDADAREFLRLRNEIDPREPMSAEAFAELRARPRRLDVLALLEGEPVGIGSCGDHWVDPDGPLAFVNARVRASARRRGVGGAVLRRLADEARLARPQRLLHGRRGRRRRLARLLRSTAAGSRCSRCRASSSRSSAPPRARTRHKRRP